MKKIESFFTSDENIICRADKNDKYAIFVFLFIFGLGGLPATCRVIIAIVTNEITSSFGKDLFISAFCFMMGLSTPIMASFLYTSGEIVLTNKRFFIKNGLTGKLVIIPLENIAGTEKLEYNYRMTSYYLRVHLLDGKKLHSDLSYSKDGIDCVIKSLADMEIKEFDFFKMKYGRYKKPITGEILYQKYTISPMVPITVITLYVIPIVMFIVYISAFT